MRPTTTQAWREALRELVDGGRPVSPLSAGAAWRGRDNREILAYQTRVPMDRAVVISRARKMGYRFMCAEAAWILSGDNRVETIAPYAEKIKGLSDDGIRYFGAYGPKVMDQLSYAVRTLFSDLASRQAVVNIWREQPRSSRDVPCTLSLQFLIRDGKLHCAATMRSSDIVMGWCYDVFNFSAIAAAVAIELRALSSENINDEDKQTLEELELGDLHLTAGSQHLYDVDQEMAGEAILEEDGEEPLRLSLAEFRTTKELVSHLWALARRDGTAKHRWLMELVR